ncbi:MAG: hypothetical protein VYA30_09405 [Myxococcota bacterium]|nr:hypothetical protein [Myxococcota bacterium]
MPTRHGQWCPFELVYGQQLLSECCMRAAIEGLNIQYPRTSDSHDSDSNPKAKYIYSPVHRRVDAPSLGRRFDNLKIYSAQSVVGAMLINVNLLPMQLEAAPRPPIEEVTVDRDPLGHPCPRQFRDKVLVDVIHDGSSLPSVFRLDQRGVSILGDEPFPPGFVRERDWGAELVANRLASALGLDSYHRVNLARVLMDFGRFPGITSAGADHLHRYAINYPFSDRLNHEQKRSVLTEHYDRISDGLESAMEGKLLKIAIHTYDKRNPTKFERPAVSLLTRPYGYQALVENPFPHFDPSFPSRVIEYTADRLLKARIAQTLEESAIHTADNFPYSLPEGSVEVRAQVWYFYKNVQSIFERAVGPSTATAINGRCPRKLVWTMLLDTNLRSAESQSLRSYLHMFRTAPTGKKALFAAAQREYEQITDFIQREYDYLVSSYREGPQRPSTILVEVRKDLVWEFDDGRPIGPRLDNATYIARKLALGISQYLSQDRIFKERSSVNKGFL